MIRRRRLRHAVLMLALGCAILAVSCGLGAAAVRQGAIAPPDMNIQIGRVRVVGITSHSPDCTRLLIPGCTPLNRIPTVHIYTLWLFVQRDPNSWDRPSIRSLFSVQIGDPHTP